MNKIEKKNKIKRESMADGEVLQFLPKIYNILKGIEEGQDITQKIKDFKLQIEQAKSQINSLPGVNLSPEEQHKLEEYTKKQIVLKTDLLEKYKQLCAFQR